MSSPLLPPAPQASREDSARSLALRARDLLLAPLIAAGHAALARALAALLALFEKWQSGTLPPPPAPRAAPTPPPAPRPAPAPQPFAPLAWLMGILRPSFLDMTFPAEPARRTSSTRPYQPRASHARPATSATRPTPPASRPNPAPPSPTERPPPAYPDPIALPRAHPHSRNRPGARARPPPVRNHPCAATPTHADFVTKISHSTNRNPATTPRGNGGAQPEPGRYSLIVFSSLPACSGTISHTPSAISTMKTGMHRNATAKDPVDCCSATVTNGHSTKPTK